MRAIHFYYSIEILKGYTFKPADIFSKYDDKMYNLRKSYPVTDPMNMVAKMLMNSLYGKFGMKSETFNIEIFDRKDPLQLESLDKKISLHGDIVKDLLELDDYIILYTPSLLK